MTTLTTDTSTLTILSPSNDVEPKRADLARRPASLSGLRVGLLDNGKPNSDRLLQHLGSALVTAQNLEISMVVRKPAIGRLAPSAIVDELVASCDVVVTGVGRLCGLLLVHHRRRRGAGGQGNSGCCHLHRRVRHGRRPGGHLGRRSRV